MSTDIFSGASPAQLKQVLASCLSSLKGKDISAIDRSRPHLEGTNQPPRQPNFKVEVYPPEIRHLKIENPILSSHNINYIKYFLFPTT